MSPRFSPPLLHRRMALAACAAFPLAAKARLASAPTDIRPPPLLLAREADLSVDPAGYLVSEKFDGVRALWDGRQLRFRGGAVVPAPAWFTAGLPAGQALDGELWLARGRFDALSGVVRREHPVDAEWRAVRYPVFELPGAVGGFAERAARLQALAAATPLRSWEPALQQRLASRAELKQRFDDVVAGGGEGLMLHRADAPYRTGRSDVLLKLKPERDAEAVVIGHTPGRGQFEGQLGALRVRDDSGRVFLVGSGLSQAQRASPPPLGSLVTYTWRGETATGLPRFPTLLRLREPGL